jgi:ribonuclease D
VPPARKPPTRTEIAELEPFASLELDQITLVTDATVAEAAFRELSAAGCVGFDTESRPTFRKGEKQDGPHVFQFSTVNRAFIFQSARRDTVPVLLRLLSAPDIAKVGFGLSGDFRQIRQRFGIRPAATTDIDREFRKLGYRDALGVRSAVALLFNRKLRKSKSITTSNWAAPRLSETQLCYAATDAYAALLVHQALRDNHAAIGAAPEKEDHANQAVDTGLRCHHSNTGNPRNQGLVRTDDGEKAPDH